MSTPVEVNLINNDFATVPPPDMLCVGPKGTFHTDIVHLITAADADLKRGTLIMTGTTGSGDTAETGFVPATEAGLGTNATFAILADPITLASTENTDIAAYFEGDFNENAVIFPWETESDDHADIVEAARGVLRRQKIFLRTVHA